ncbi:MAG TPA: penicillin-binding transpeptidase domain-containing protein [Pantanalinema sp.]
MTRLLLAALLVLGASAQAKASSLQQVATEALGSREGCIVALDPRDGTLLALVNPRVAAGGTYPVGSIAKLVTGLASLEAGLTDPARRLRCDGRYGAHRCWRRHGKLDLEEAIAQSCSTYFYAQGEALGSARLRAAFLQAGFGVRTGIGLPYESAGRLGTLTTREQVLDLAYGDTPLLLATPLQVASFTAALASGGVRRRPHWPGEPGRVLGAVPGGESLEAVRAGMRRAVLSGTAQPANVPGLALFGKTGSATQLAAPHLRHGWFAGFSPTLAVVVFVKHGTGFEAAAPIARRVFEGARS